MDANKITWQDRLYAHVSALEYTLTRLAMDIRYIKEELEQKIDEERYTNHE